MAAGPATAALAVVLRIRTGRVRAGEQRERAHAAERERVECAVELVYADWLDLEATRGWTSWSSGAAAAPDERREGRRRGCSRR